MQHGMKLDIFYAKNNSIIFKYLIINYNREVELKTTLTLRTSTVKTLQTNWKNKYSIKSGKNRRKK
jgi:hypothetical protein